MANFVYWAYSPPTFPSLLSKTSSTEAVLTGLRVAEPLKTTSAILLPRKCLAELSPITQRMASIILDFPQPLGPTIAIKLPSIGIVIWSTNDLNPKSFIFSSFIATKNFYVLIIKMIINNPLNFIFRP